MTTIGSMKPKNDIDEYLKQWKKWPVDVRQIIFGIEKAKWDLKHEKELKAIIKQHNRMPGSVQELTWDWWKGKEEIDNYDLWRGYAQWVWEMGWSEVKREVESYAKHIGLKFKFQLPK